MIIGKMIKELRCELNLTQKQLAEMLALTPKMISFYENNQRFPPIDILIKLSTIFNVSTDYLLGLGNSSYEYLANPTHFQKSDPEYATMINFWNMMDHGKKMMTLGYMERLAEEPTKIVVNINKNPTTSGNKNGVNG